MAFPVFEGDKQAYTQAILDHCPPRYAVPEDVERLVEFDRAVFPEGGTHGPRYLTRHIEHNPIGIEVIDIGGRIVACAVGDMFPSNVEEGRCYGDIASLGIAEDHRGRGLGDLLLSRMVVSMLTENPTGIGLHTRVSNLAMQGLAAKHGFRIEDTDPDYYARTRVPEAGHFMVFRPGQP